jgi:hypothetical protein
MLFELRFPGLVCFMVLAGGVHLVRAASQLKKSVFSYAIRPFNKNFELGPLPWLSKFAKYFREMAPCVAAGTSRRKMNGPLHSRARA